MTRAEEQESFFLIRQDLENFRSENQALSDELELEKLKNENLQQELQDNHARLEESFRAREEAEKVGKSKAKECNELKKKIKDLINSNSSKLELDVEYKDILLDEEVVNIKKENAATKQELSDLRDKIFNLKNMWRAHILRNNSLESSGKVATSSPKKLITSFLDSSSSVRLEEELISSRLAEVDSVAQLQESQSLVRDLEHQVKTSRHHLSRQDALVIRLQEELEMQKRKQSELQSAVRDADVKLVNLEGKLKDERLMSRISEAENSQVVAELKQKIISLELISQETQVLDNLQEIDENGFDDDDNA